jgi:hypothetical protein
MKVHIPQVKLTFDVHLLDDKDRVTEVKTIDAKLVEAGFSISVDNMVAQLSAELTKQIEKQTAAPEDSGEGNDG